MMEERVAVRERRRHPRYKMADVAAVVGERRLGHVLDMSMGGLAFSYIQMQARPEKEIELGIIFGEGGRYLDKLPAETVSDCVMSHGPPNHPVVIRRRSVRFGDLTPEQRQELAEFISHHSRGRC